MNNQKKIYFMYVVIYLLIILDGKGVYGQVSEGGVPFSYRILNASQRDEKIPQYSLPALDTVELHKQIKIEKEKCKDCRKDFYGKGEKVKINFFKDALKNTTSSGVIWRYKIKVEGALGIQLYFEKFEIPEGGRFFIYNENASMVLGAFTEKSNQDKGAFALQPIDGNVIILEYFESSEVKAKAKIDISEIVNIFSNIYERNGIYDVNGVGADYCNVNVSCPTSSGWDKEIRSVALILYNTGTNGLKGLCSGALINNTAQNGKPYFLTARHCTSWVNGEYYDYIFLFNYQDQACTGNGTSASRTQSISGATLLVCSDKHTYHGSDYALMELKETIPVSYNVCFAGWDRTETGGTLSSETVGIHHPNGDVKKISRDYNPPLDGSYIEKDGSIIDNTLNHWNVSWDMGITAKGSSGSPLFNASHKIIGQLHGGASTCSNPQAFDQYGKFFYSWNEGYLATYLSPAGNALTLDTYCPVYTSSCQNGKLDAGETKVDCGGSCPPCPATCSDQILNQNETAVDCGGVCPSCQATCWDGIRNQGEVEVDCGGPCIGCPPPSCNDQKQNQNETGIDCGGVCPLCETFCNDGNLNGNETAVDCGGSCSPCPSILINGGFQNNTCDWSNQLVYYYPFNQNGNYCVEGPWYASHGAPFIKHYTNGNKGLGFNSTWFPYNNHFEVITYGVYYQFPFKLDPDKIYTLNFKYQDHIELGYSPMNYLAFYATNGLVPFTKPNPSNADCLLPTYPFSKYLLKEYSNKNGTPATVYTNREFSFTVPGNSFDQLWIFAYNYRMADYTDLSFLYLDDLTLTVKNKPCANEIIYNNTNSIPNVSRAKSIVTQNTVTIEQMGSKIFRAQNFIELNPGFSTEPNSVFLATILSCEDSNPTLRNATLEYSDENSTTEDGQELKTSFIKVYPNPTTGLINVSVLGEMTNMRSVIYNSLGQIVYEGTIPSISNNEIMIDLYDHSPGIYTLSITSDQVNENQLVVIE